MKKLTVREVLAKLTEIVEQDGKKALDYKVYLGNDEELNDIHSAFFVQKISRKNTDDVEGYYNEYSCLNEEQEDSILLS